MGLYKATRLPAWSPEEVKHQRPAVSPLLSSGAFLFQVMGLKDLGVRLSGTGQQKSGRWSGHIPYLPE